MIEASDPVLLATGIVAYETLTRLRLGEPAGRLGRVGFEARATMSSASLQDDDKERLVRAMAGRTLADTLRLAARLALVAGACTLAIWLGSSLAGVPATATLARATSWQGLVGLSLAVAAWAGLRRGLARSPTP